MQLTSKTIYGEVHLQQSNQCHYHNFFMLLCGIVDALLNGVPLEDPLLVFVSEEFFFF